jgi:hypothetical protein
MGKLVNQLRNILMCMGKEEMKSIFLQLRIMLTHQTHTFLKSWKWVFQQTLLLPLEVGQTHTHLGISGHLNHTLSRLAPQPYESRKERKSQPFGKDHEICFSPTSC